MAVDAPADERPTVRDDVVDQTLPAKQAASAGLTASRVRELYEKGAKATGFERRQYWINRSMLAGEQWIWWDERRELLHGLPTDPERPRLTVNHLLPSSRVVMGKLLRRPLVFEVPPSGSDDASVLGARTAEAVLVDVHREHKWEELRRQVAWLAWKGGTSVLCLEWDPAAGTPLGRTESGTHYGTGDTCEHALSVAEATWEPGVRDAERGRYWVKAVALPTAEVKERYRLKEAPQADASAALSPLQQRLLGDSRNEGGNAELALVLTYYERPTNDGPGQVAVVVGNEFVWGPKPWPFPFRDRLNMVVIRETPIDGRSTGDTVLSAAVPVQVAYNRAHTSIDEHMDKAGNARLAVPEGADDEQFTDDPADLVRFPPGADSKPFYISPPQMPAWWVTRPDMLRDAMDDILGVHDVSRGQAPANVGSGIGLTILAEHDDTPLGAFAKEMAEAWGRFATLVLRTLESRVKERRSAVVRGHGHMPRRVAWDGAKLAGQTTATVPLEAVAPRSHAAQLQLAMELWAAGVFRDDPIAFARFAELPGADDFTAGLDPHVDKARRENWMFVVGEVPVPADFDNHATHVAEHNRFRLSSAYDELDDETRIVVDTHVLAHETLAAEEMGTQLARGAVSPALAAAAQAHEPPLAGDAAALAQLPPPPGVDPAAADPAAAPAAAPATGPAPVAP